MRNRLVEAIEAAYQRSDPPRMEIGDEVEVGVRIIEGNKERVQPFIGTVIARRGRGTNATFTVRRIVADEGVERTFPLHSPKIASVKVRRHGKVRRAKLYYLRDRIGKARKLRKRIGRKEKPIEGQADEQGSARASRRETEEAGVAVGV